MLATISFVAHAALVALQFKDGPVDWAWIAGAARVAAPATPAVVRNLRLVVI